MPLYWGAGRAAGSLLAQLRAVRTAAAHHCVTWQHPLEQGPLPSYSGCVWLYVLRVLIYLLLSKETALCWSHLCLWTALKMVRRGEHAFLSWGKAVPESQGQLVQTPEEGGVGDVTSSEPPPLDQNGVVPGLAQSSRADRASSKAGWLPWHLAAATSRSCSGKCGNWREQLQVVLAKCKNTAQGNIFWKV